MDKVTKAAGGVGSNAVSTEELEKINRMTLEPLTEDEVYTFKVNLCDDQVDRDFERFSLSALECFSTKFVGRPIIFDHTWSAKMQTARIYEAQVLNDGGVNRLQAKAYLLKNEANADTIAAIRGGILREVSVCVAVNKRTCSICGADYYDCGHRRGETYNGQQCVCVLDGAADVYEASFVAVPAQREAGVTKSAAAEPTDTERQEQAARNRQRSRARLALEYKNL